MTKTRGGRHCRLLVRVCVALALPLWSVLWVASAGAATVPTWSTLSPPQSPPGLVDASASYDADDQTVVLFGGQQADGSLSGATWLWDGTTWSQAPAQVSGPTPRQGAAMAYDANLHQLILFGGIGPDGALLGDTWAWNGQSWVLVSGAQEDGGSGPANREGASLAVDATGNLALFGGTGASSAGAAAAAAGAPAGSAANDSATVAAANPSTTTSPPEAASSGASSAPVAASSTDSGLITLNDTWIWDGTSWSQPEVSTSPNARTDASFVWDPALGQTVLFGGSATPVAGTAQPQSDTWIWSGSAWTELSTDASPPASYDAASASSSELGGDVVSSGSGTQGAGNQTWSFDGATWTQLATDGSLPARSGAASAWDAAASQFVVFGGTGGNGAALGDTVVLTQTAPLTITPTTEAGNGATSSTSSSSPTTGNTTSTTTSDAGGSTTTQPADGPASSPPTTATVPASGSTASSGPSGASGNADGTTSTTPKTTTSTTNQLPATSQPKSPAVTLGGDGNNARISGSGTAPPSVATTNPSTSPVPLAAASPTPVPASAAVQTVHTGSLVTVVGSGFRPGAIVTITFHSKPYTIGRTIASAGGTFAATVTVPITASVGDHHIEASGVNRNGRLNVLVTPLRVVALVEPSSSHHDRTTLVMMAVAVFLPVGTWAFLGLRSRRQRAVAG